MWIAVTSTPCFSDRGLRVKRSHHVMSYHVFTYVGEEAVCSCAHTRSGGHGVP